jgi:hypothetical protein
MNIHNVVNAFELGKNVEQKSRMILEPLLEQTTDGRFVYTDKGRLAVEFQKKYGDVLIQEKKTSAMWSIEVKAEEKSSPNLFLEVWSNGERYNPGWMTTCEADLLFYHFIESDELYISKLPILKKWFHFGKGFKGINEFQYEPGYKRFSMKMQKKYQQKNDTWGICVPVGVIEKEVGIKKINPLGLFDMKEAA